MVKLGIAAAALALVGAMVYQNSDGQQNRQLMKWKTEEGRITQGPFEGYLAESPERDDKLVLTAEQWRERLTDEQYRILRAQGTETPFCSPFLDNKKEGVYVCAACGQPTYASNAKFTSGTGWPSFFQPINKDAVWLRADNSHGMARVEILCSRCDSHHGHAFLDGPRDKTGIRLCINGESLTFVEKD